MLGNAQKIREKVKNGRFESISENLHQCKTQRARKKACGESQKEAQAYIPLRELMHH